MNTVVADAGSPIVLCIEDEPDLREDLMEELEAAGYTAIAAIDGDDALDCLDTITPELILCDITMPGRDGYELLRYVRESRPELATVPFVFLTAQADSEQIIQGKLSGADDYLVKPVNYDLMLATIACRIGQVSRIQGRYSSLRSKSGQTGAARPSELRHAEQALDYIASGVMVLDGKGAVRFANQLARQLVQGIEPLTLANLEGADAQDAQRLQQLVEAGLTASGVGHDYMAGLAILRGPGLGDLIATVCSLSAHHQNGKPEPAIAVFLSDKGYHPPVPKDVLHALFGLTPTEAQIAWAFTEGKRTEEIAQEFSISPTTVAFHKRNIFQKTRTHRQADLIAVMLTLPVQQTAVQPAQ